MFFVGQKRRACRKIEQLEKEKSSKVIMLSLAKIQNEHHYVVMDDR